MTDDHLATAGTLLNGSAAEDRRSGNGRERKPDEDGPRPGHGRSGRHDPDCDEATELAWRWALTPGITFMKLYAYLEEDRGR